MNLTQRQRQAVEHRGSNLLVSASAGSGKTEVLARRCVSLIADVQRPLDVDRMLVVTFTRAAAAELRERIGRMLREQAELCGDDRRLRRHLRRQQALIETAEIGTIDAWCARLAREHFDQLTPGIDPAFGVLGVEEAEILRGDVLDELFEWIYAADDEVAEASRAWIRRHAKPSDEFLRELVQSLNRYREHLVNPEQWLQRQLGMCGGDERTLQSRAAETLAADLRAECAFQLSQIDGLIAEVHTSAVREQLKAYREALQEWESAASHPENIEATASEVAAYRFPRKPRDCDPRDEAFREEIKKRWHEKRLKKRWSPDQVTSIVHDAVGAAELAATLLRLEARYHDLLEARKRARGAYEFGDVLRMALDLLGTPGEGARREPTEIALSLQRRYEHVLVDEYQDTSPVQVELLRLATRCEPGRTNRFMVGDVKQSIYGFREAEPRLLSGLIEAYAGRREEGDVLFLPDNFRSHARLVSGLNEIFAGLFDLEFGGAHYEGEERLVAGRDEIVNPTLDGDSRIEMLIVANNAASAVHDDAEDENGGEDDIPLERIELEGRAAARRIHELVERRTRVPERGADGELTTRPLRWSDVVILLRSARKSAPQLAAALRDAGIPCAAAGRESILDSLEVRDVRAAMSLEVNRQQDIPLASYLRGPMVGLSEGQLLSVRRELPEDSFYKAVQAYRTDGADATLIAVLDRAMTRLESWSVAARTEILPNLLRRIIRETSLEHFARSLPGGEHRAAMLHALESMAEEFARRGRSGLAEFVDYLDALDERNISPDAAAAVGDDVVRIMTIHAAKGLEFPVVFLLGAGTEFSRRPRRGSLECDELGGIGLSFFDYPAGKQFVSAAFDVNRRRSTQRELEEELRLLYVAATRAREKLFVVGHARENAWSDWRERYSEAGGDVPLLSRLGAASMLEWMMQGAACSLLDHARGGESPALHAAVLRSDDLNASEPPSPDDEPTTPAPALTEADRDWIELGRLAIQTAPDQALARRPAVLSVSVVKQQAAREHESDLPLSLEYAGGLTSPSFEQAATIDGRTVGDAYHRFMQLTDLTRLASEDSIRAQMNDLVAAGRMTDEETALIDAGDVAWFAGTDIGQALVAGAAGCRREAPFVYAYPVGASDERVILRGVIDCLLDTNEGLVVLDYKTDRPVDAEDWRRRLAGYGVQLQLYAVAAAAVFDRPICAAKLAFLRERRIESADVRAPKLEEIMSRLREA